jgi:transcriptional regulator with XRE-family HTH domain
MILSGEKVKSKRINKNITQLDLSASCDLTVELISKIENNKRSNTSLETAYKLAKYFNVTIEELI